MKTLWVPGINNLGNFGRWAFAEFTDVFEIESAFGLLVNGMIKLSQNNLPEREPS